MSASLGDVGRLAQEAETAAQKAAKAAEQVGDQKVTGKIETTGKKGDA